MEPTLTDIGVPAVPRVPSGLMIANRFVAASDGREFVVTDPATTSPIATVADAGTDDALRALDLAVEVSSRWAAASPRSRADILRAAYELVIRRRDQLTLLITLEMGKPLAESAAEVTYAAEFLRWFSEEATRIAGTTSVAPYGDSRIVTVRQPVGPCLLVTPWNFPLAMGTRKIGPALAAGCTVLVKPATATPLAMNALGEIFVECGLPAGVMSILPTSRSPEVVAALLDDSRLRKLSFTGSTAVGRRLIEQSGANVIRTSMELGGNAPLIVCPDADIEHAAAETIKAKLRNNGEACTAANVIYVHAEVADAFCQELTERWERLTVGPGYCAQTDVGPLISTDAVSGIQALLDDAVGRGAEILCQARVPDGNGSYLAPTLLRNVSADAPIVHQEIFGPVAPVVTWTDDETLLWTLNRSEYGLAAYLFTSNMDRARMFVERLEVGMVGVNRGVLSDVAAPFGGVKHSGFGREGGAVGVDEYLSTKYVAVDAPLGSGG